jgi:hypothetical protein
MQKLRKRQKTAALQNLAHPISSLKIAKRLGLRQPSGALVATQRVRVVNTKLKEGVNQRIKRR